MSLSPPIPFLPLPVGTTAGAVSPPLITTANNQSHSSSSSSSPFENLKPSILIIILILSITLLVSLSLCLLLRLLNRRCLHPLSSSSTAAASSNRHNNNSRRVSPDSFLLDSLPLFTFSSIHRRSSSSSGDCAVCLSKFEPNDQLRLLPLCCHAFHSACIDTWLISNQSCPLCRSPLHASDSDILKAAALSSSVADDRSGSFRLEIGSVSRRQNLAAGSDEVDRRRGGSYSIGSFDYVVDEEELEVITTNVQTQGGHRRSVSENKEEADDDLAAEVGRSSWIKDYVDRLSASMSSRALSFRSSGGFFGGGGSSRRSLEAGGEYEAEEANRYGEEISELFRWFSGV